MPPHFTEEKRESEKVKYFPKFIPLVAELEFNPYMTKSESKVMATVTFEL